MRRRFTTQNLNLQFVKPVESTDVRVLEAPLEVRRNWAIMFNHLDMLTEFLQSSAEYGIFCEDDIFIRKGFSTFLPEIIQQFNRHNLEILLLGYLVPYKVVEIRPASEQFREFGPNFTIHRYPDDTWGSQMYMLNRKSASQLLQTYSLEYARRTLSESDLTPFSPDWTLTKDSEHRACIYPMLAVEEGIVMTTHQGQIDFHRRCFQAQFNSSDFV